MIVHEVSQALQVWTLQNLLNLSIMLGILACGLALIQGYYRAIEKLLSARGASELWRALTVVVVDVLLAVVVLAGYLVLNPDIMANIKMAVPFCPIATVLFAVALVLRLCRGGHDATSRNYTRSLWFMLVANLLNMLGFTLVMEAPGSEYLLAHRSPFWEYLKAHLRSNAAPHGLRLSQLTFYVCFPLLMAVLIWGVRSALASGKQSHTKG